MKFDHLMLEQLDEQLRGWDKLKSRPAPRKGWINLIRSALGLNTRQLAEKLGVNQSRVVTIEQAERNTSITLRTLEKTARAMGCRLVYGLVHETSLHTILEQQAQKVAKNRLSRVSHSMGLEAQDVEVKKQKQQLAELIQELLEDSPKKLWRDDK